MPNLPKIDSASRVRWLLPISLALNVFFVGAAGAVALRYTGSVPLTNVARMNHSLSARLNEIAATLPAADADLLRTKLGAEAREVASAQADVRLAREALRNALRADPFDANAMRSAMAADRAAHESFEMVLHDLIASAAGKMSVVGRNKLADWSSAHNSAAAATTTD